MENSLPFIGTQLLIGMVVQLFGSEGKAHSWKPCGQIGGHDIGDPEPLNDGIKIRIMLWKDVYW